MHFTHHELGIMQVVLERFHKHRLPRLLSLKERVDGGGLLGDFDLPFLTAAIDELKGGESFVERHPEFQRLLSEVASLYHDITEKALENEQREQRH